MINNAILRVGKAINFVKKRCRFSYDQFADDASSLS